MYIQGCDGAEADGTTLSQNMLPNVSDQNQGHFLSPDILI